MQKVGRATSADQRMRIFVSDGYLFLAEPRKSLEYFNLAAEDTVNVSDPFLLDSLYRFSAFAYNSMNNRTKALELHLQRIRVLSTVDTLSKNLAAAYYEAGHIFLSQGEPDLAIPYLEKCQEVSHNVHYSTLEGQVLIDRGDMAFDKEEYDQAIEYYERAVDIFMKSDHLKFVGGYAIAKIAKTYSVEGNGSKALDEISKALVYVDTSRGMYIDYSGGIYELAGEVYLKQGHSRKAIASLRKALDLFERYDKYYSLPLAYKLLSEAYKKVNVDSAYVYLEKFVAINDSALSKENSDKIAQLRFEFEEEQKEQQIQLLEQEKELINKNKELAEAESQRKSQSIRIFVLAFVLVLLLLVAAIYMFRNSKIQNKLINEQKRLVEERNKEIEDSIIYAERIQRAVI